MELNLIRRINFQPNLCSPRVPSKTTNLALIREEGKFRGVQRSEMRDVFSPMYLLLAPKLSHLLLAPHLKSLAPQKIAKIASKPKNRCGGARIIENSLHAPGCEYVHVHLTLRWFLGFYTISKYDYSFKFYKMAVSGKIKPFSLCMAKNVV